MRSSSYPNSGKGKLSKVIAGDPSGNSSSEVGGEGSSSALPSEIVESAEDDFEGSVSSRQKCGCGAAPEVGSRCRKAGDQGCFSPSFKVGASTGNDDIETSVSSEGSCGRGVVSGGGLSSDLAGDEGHIPSLFEFAESTENDDIESSKSSKGFRRRSVVYGDGPPSLDSERGWIPFSLKSAASADDGDIKTCDSSKGSSVYGVNPGGVITRDAGSGEHFGPLLFKFAYFSAGEAVDIWVSLKGIYGRELMSEEQVRLI